MRSGNEALTDKYEQLWRANKDFVRSNQLRLDPLPQPKEPRWGVSAVFKPVLPPAIWDALDGLKRTAGSHHAYYTPDNAHITLRSNENFRYGPSSDDPDVQGYAMSLADVWDDADVPIFECKGIIAVPSSILLCCYPAFDMVALRKRYAERLRKLDLIRPGPEADPGKLRDTCHVSLAVFSGPLRDPAAFEADVSQLADRPFGRALKLSLDIVAYGRTLKTVTTNTLVRVPVKF